MGRLNKFEGFLKDVQAAYSDEFTDLHEIATRYQLLNTTNTDLWKNNDSSTHEIDNINNHLDKFKKEAGQKSLTYTNLIAEEQRQL